jgi:hypothetical protein
MHLREIGLAAVRGGGSLLNPSVSQSHRNPLRRIRGEL